MHSVVSYGSTAMAFGWFGDTAMSPFNLFWGFFCVWQIHKASTQRSFTFSYPKINQNWLVLSSGASSQVACTGGSRMECGIPQLGSTACPKNVLSPPERLCRRRGFFGCHSGCPLLARGLAVALSEPAAGWCSIYFGAR